MYISSSSARSFARAIERRRVSRDAIDVSSLVRLLEQRPQVRVRPSRPRARSRRRQQPQRRRLRVRFRAHAPRHHARRLFFARASRPRAQTVERPARRPLPRPSSSSFAPSRPPELIQRVHHQFIRHRVPPFARGERFRASSRVVPASFRLRDVSLRRRGRIRGRRVDRASSRERRRRGERQRDGGAVHLERVVPFDSARARGDAASSSIRVNVTF